MPLKFLTPYFVNKTKAMKKLSCLRIINKLLLCILCISIFSCNKKENYTKVTIIDLKPAKKDPILDLNLIDCLDESNQKIIELSTITFDITTDVETLQLLVKIRKNHQKIDSDFNNLSKKNLIIVPHLTYHIDLNPNSVRSKKGELYLLKTLEKEFVNQITLLNRINNISNNIDFKTFAVQSKKTVEDNNIALLNITKDLQ